MNLELILKMSIALGAVLLCFGLCVLAFRKFGTRFGLGMTKKLKRKSSSEIEVMAFHNLGPGKAVYLMKVEGRKVLIGATQQNLTALADLGEDLTDEQNGDSFVNTLRDRNSEEKNIRFGQSFLGLPRI